MKHRVIVRMYGGLGNQLFSYAAARRLSLVNDAELVIDDVTGFARDHLYRRKYALRCFSIDARKATPRERLEPFERFRRAALKLWSRCFPFQCRRYIQQEGRNYDSRLLNLSVRKNIIIEGAWQSERYFKDIEKVIRKDLTFISPTDALNLSLAKSIRNASSVALHVRWFDTPESSSSHNMSLDYYRRAINYIETHIDNPHFFIFSDDPKTTYRRLSISRQHSTFISHNCDEDSAYADLWLMSQCKHFIIANSTFSWWGAWLSRHRNKIVVAPKIKLISPGFNSWNFPGQLPESFTLL